LTKTRERKRKKKEDLGGEGEGGTNEIDISIFEILLYFGDIERAGGKRFERRTRGE